MIELLILSAVLYAINEAGGYWLWYRCKNEQWFEKTFATQSVLKLILGIITIIFAILALWQGL